MSQRQPIEAKESNSTQKQGLVQAAGELGLSHAVVQRGLANPRALAPNDILQLQRTIGNQAVQRMLSGQLQRSSQEGFEAGKGFEQQLNRTKGGGNPLPRKTQDEFESSFGANFSNVRIHTGAESNQLNRSIQAKAFTHGNDIHFSAGEYNPASSQGKQLLAHELTHTIQQTGSNPTKSVQTKLQVGAANDRYEQEADRVATQVTKSNHKDALQPKRLQKSIKPEGAAPGTIRRKLDFTADMLDGGEAISDKYYAMAGKNETYIILKQLLNRYHNSTRPEQQLRLLQQIKAIAMTWLNKNDPTALTGVKASKTQRFAKSVLGGNKAKKSLSLQFLIQYIDDELPNAQEAVTKSQDDYVKKVHSGGMKYITESGLGIAKNMKQWMTDPSQFQHPMQEKVDQGFKAHALIKQYGLTEAEATAIGIYSAGDYKYMNPSVAGNKSWLHSQMVGATSNNPAGKFADPKIVQEVLAGAPVKQDATLGTNKNKSKNPFKGSQNAPATAPAPGAMKPPTPEESQKFEEHAEGARLEGLEHAEVALSGLKKLPDTPGDTWRGVVLTHAEFKAKYPLGSTTRMEAFSSSSLNDAVAEGFIHSNQKKGKVNILLQMHVTKGKDIKQLSDSSTEDELLLLPGATFKVVSIKQYKTKTWKDDVQLVEMQQIR